MLKFESISTKSEALYDAYKKGDDFFNDLKILKKHHDGIQATDYIIKPIAFCRVSFTLRVSDHSRSLSNLNTPSISLMHTRSHRVIAPAGILKREKNNRPPILNIF